MKTLTLRLNDIQSKVERGKMDINNKYSLIVNDVISPMIEEYGMPISIINL